MSEGPDPAPLRPEQDERMRALLAELGSGPDGEPVPPPIAARLEDTLAQLVAERRAAAPSPGLSSGPHQAPAAEVDPVVVPLRRRWATRGAAAAAAVILVAGGGLAASSLGLLGGEGGTTSGSAGSSTAGDERSLDAGPRASNLAPPDREPGQAPEPTPGLPSTSTATPQQGQGTGRGSAGQDPAPALSAESFQGQVTVLLSTRAVLTTPSSPSARGLRREVPMPIAPIPTSGTPTSPGPTQVGSCVSPRLTDGSRVTAITFDGTPAVLVVHPLAQGHRLVEAWSCAGTDRLARTRVAAPASTR